MGNSEGSARALLMEPYLSALRDRGITAHPLLVGAGLHRLDLSNQLQHLPLGSFLRFTQLVAEATQDPCIGLKLGAVRRPEMGPIIRHLFLVSGSLREALDHFCEAATAFQEQTTMQLVRHGKRWQLIYRIESAEPELARQDTEYSLAMFCSLIRYRLGEDWRPIEVHFAHDASPRHMAICDSVFRCRVQFRQPVNGIVMTAEDLDKTNPYLGGTIVNLLCEHLQGLGHDMEQAHSVSHRVRLKVTKYLGSGHLSLANIASELNMSVRNMQRHLAVEGLSFRDIVRQQREQLASSMIHNGRSKSLADIAAALGYSDETALSRAFKSWHGIPPRRYANRIRRHQGERGHAST